MADSVRFARLTYRWAAIYGLIVLLPQYFREQRIGRDTPPPSTHPEYFYGFVGLALAWQVGFLVISTDPVRYRALMPVTLLEKLAFGAVALILFALGRTPAEMAIAGSIDLALGACFAVALARLRQGGG